MQVNPLPTQVPTKPLATPAAQAVLQPAVAAAATAGTAVKTQTVQATPTIGKADQGRAAAHGTDTKEAADPVANAVGAATNGRPRGSLLDVSV
jgi:hypothetical protein